MPGRLIYPAKFVKCFVYILKNNKGKHYTGITKLKPEMRLLRHNKGDVYATRFGRPWTIVYIEKHDNYKLARIREKQIKSWKGGNAFKRFLSKFAGSSNGRTSPFEGEYLGSNPGPAAIIC